MSGTGTPQASTTERLIEHYNSVNRRRTAHDPHNRDVMFRSFDRVFGRFLPAERSTRILDVGCGEGSFLSYLVARGYENLSGFDLSQENVSICRAAGLDFVRRFDALELDRLPAEQRFGRIFALDLLEHLPKESAGGFLERARDRLLPGGLLVVQTPNMGCVYGNYHRHFDLTHEFGLTERTAHSLFRVAGFGPDDVQVLPAWNATTALGRLREVYARVLHLAVFLAEDRDRPKIPTKNLLIQARR